MSRRNRTQRRIIIALIGLPALLVLTLVGLAFVWSQGPMEEGPEIPDLRPQVSEEENAWPLLLEAANQRKSIDESALAESLKQPWQDHPQIEKALQENKEALTKLDEGLTRKALLVPPAESYDKTFPYLPQWRGLARLKTARGYTRIRHGDTDGGLQDFVGVVRFGYLVENSGGGTLHYLVGVALKTIGYDALQKALGPPPELRPKQEHGHPSGGSARDLAAWRQAMKEMGRWEESRSGLRRALAGEYQVMVQQLDQLPARSIFYQPRKTKAWARRYFAAALEQADRPWWEQKQITIPEAKDPKGLGVVSFYLNNPIGRIMLGISLPVFDKIPAKSTRLEAQCAATHTHVALKCYLETEGYLPNDLQQLVPNEMSAVPTDPFDGQPLRYDPARGLVYSVGPNRIDDGGKEEKKEWETQGDLVFPLRFVPMPE